ncbi:cupin domain-containing protein [Variovorax saccharolyticus]|uniref:cupin domain-containing protein n=1 Tax=Variovorax saccharolyticus TaxID=3053516 RepID=UPI002576F314|nr:cupin domain-containing protein [Variovorax sp. J22R187]MDM0022272.1 cupin domain-containing protein [Variovorax sp. J22R187]
MRFLTKLVSSAAIAACITGAGAQTLGPVASGASAGESSGNPAQSSLPVKQFGSVLSENVRWQAFPAFPPQARLAVLVGEPAKPGPYVVRVKLPGGVKLMPHTHPEDRIYTVVSGVFYIGLGTTFDPDKLQAYAPGSVVVLPANTPHFHWAKSGDYMTQVAGSGPLGIQYVDPHDDPRNLAGK